MRVFILTAMAFCLMAADSSYLLPHQNSDARHVLTQMIKAADDDILIITDSVEDAAIQRALRKALDKPRVIRLMTSRKATAASWAIYRNIQVCQLRYAEGQSLAFTLIGTPVDTLCMLSGGLDETAFRNSSALMHCSRAETYLPVIKMLEAECTPYLK